MRRAPTAVVAFWATLAELVVVAAAGNQWVVNHLVRNAKPSELPRNRELKAALTSFPWRWTPEHHQRMLWLGEIVAVVGLVVVLFLLMLAFVGPMRAPRRFVAVFLGTWGIVVALTQIAAIGQAVLAYSDLDKPAVDPDRLGRFWFGVFDGPTSETVLFGGASGLIVAIVAGLVAALTSRRADEADEESDTSMPSGDDDVPEWSAAIGSPRAYDYGSTQALGSPLGATQALGSSQLGSTQAIGSPSERVASDRTASERAASERAASEPTQSWPPPPDPADRLSGWPEPESTARLDRPTAPAPPREPAPPHRPARAESSTPTREPASPQSRDQWSNVTQSTGEPVRPYTEPPTEVTLPRAPQPTAELPPPGSLPSPTGRLPLPEEGESDES
ncbi:MAG TPA: hypothetical protein VGL21_18720 [Jatrophihabitantaceae bacterium]